MSAPGEIAPTSNLEAANALSVSNTAAQRPEALPLLLQGRHRDFWSAIVARSERIWQLLQAPAPPATPLEQAELTRLLAALEVAAGASALSGQELTDEIARVATLIPSSEQRALYQRLMLGLDPFSGLDRYCTDHLFSADELRQIEELERGWKFAKRRLPNLSWSRGMDVKYGGYVAAIVKVTRQCNLRCEYCHDWRTGPEAQMKFDVLSNTVAKLVGCASHTRIDFIWHGGEPTLVGKQGFLRVLALQSRFKSPGQQLVNILQTNATAITPAWAQFLADFAFAVNVSIDGPAQIHDQSRPMVSGKSSYAHVRRGLALLRQHGLAKGVLVVVSEQVVDYGAERLLNFLQEDGLTKVALLPLRPANPPTASSTGHLRTQRYAEFLVAMHRARLESSGPWVEIRELDMLLNLHRGAMPTHCENLGSCVGHYFSVEPNGDVGHCDKYMGDPEYTVGNLLQQGFDDIRASEKLQHLKERAEASRTPVRSCKHFEKCRGWCPHERYLAEKTRLGVQPKCCGLGPIFDALETLEPNAQAGAEQCGTLPPAV